MAATMENLDDQIDSMIETSQNSVGGKAKGKARICKVCGKEGQLVNIKNHIETQHITGVSHFCETCGNKFKSRHGLAVHKFKSKFH